MKKPYKCPACGGSRFLREAKIYVEFSFVPVLVDEEGSFIRLAEYGLDDLVEERDIVEWEDEGVLQCEECGSRVSISD